MNFKTFIKAVGTGPKGNRDLSFEESFEAVSQILKQEPTQAQMGAFLIAWRVKLEKNEEFKGAIKALNSFIKYKEVPDSLKLGYNFDGRDTNPYLFPLYEIKHSVVTFLNSSLKPTYRFNSPVIGLIGSGFKKFSSSFS